MGDVAYRQDALDKGRFAEYIIKHHRSWLTFSNELGRGLSLTDLVFVTGCDRTSDWACAAWSEKTKSARLSFVAGVPGIAQGNVNLWGRWESSQSLDKNIGPFRSFSENGIRVPVLTSPEAMSADQSPSSQITSSISPLAPPSSSNQCVFVRGFRMGNWTTWFRRKALIDVGDDFTTIRKPLDSKNRGDLTTYSRS